MEFILPSPSSVLGSDQVDMLRGLPVYPILMIYSIFLEVCGQMYLLAISGNVQKTMVLPDRRLGLKLPALFTLFLAS
jgi:hypothetical protein